MDAIRAAKACPDCQTPIVVNVLPGQPEIRVEKCLTCGWVHVEYGHVGSEH